MTLRSAALVSIFTLSFAPDLTAQVNSGSKGTEIDPITQKQLLRGPNGLKNLANLSGGHAILKDTREPGYVEYELGSATRDAFLILWAYIADSTAKLSEMGSSIDTYYKVSPVEVLKGSVEAPEITIRIRGGKVSYPDGETAEIRSITSTQIQNGHAYIFFLKRDDEGVYWPLGNFEMIFDVTRPENVIPLAKYSTNRDFRIVTELRDRKLTTLNSISAEVRAGVAEQRSVN